MPENVTEKPVAPVKVAPKRTAKLAELEAALKGK